MRNDVAGTLSNGDLNHGFLVGVGRSRSGRRVRTVFGVALEPEFVFMGALLSAGTKALGGLGLEAASEVKPAFCPFEADEGHHKEDPVEYIFRTEPRVAVLLQPRLAFKI